MFEISCPDLLHGTFAPINVLDSYGCTGSNVSLHVEWTGAPAGTRSFVFVLFDPDGNGGKGWWHWTVANIPASVTGLPQGASGRLPAGCVEAGTSFDAPGYGGPCPEEGERHQYRLTLYAIDVATLDVSAATSAAALQSLAEAHSLGVATLVVPFSR